jgi:hypothetical protein
VFSLRRTTLALVLLVAVACSRKPGGPGDAELFCRSVIPGEPSVHAETRAAAAALDVFHPASVGGFVACGRFGTTGTNCCEVHVVSGRASAAKLHRL